MVVRSPFEFPFRIWWDQYGGDFFYDNYKKYN